jgi:NADH:ubiquinone oxidoreductase subunit 6 (subunit J)
LVYAGGVNVLLIFGTMLTPDVSTPTTSNLFLHKGLAVVAGIPLFVLLSSILYSADWPLKATGEMTPTTAGVGRLLLQEYVLPFEVISFLLLASMIGALVVVKKGGQE